jgi:hypothetical protein
MDTTLPNSSQAQLLKFPAQKDIALTPAIWLALGVVSYNHALLAKAPLRILAPGELIADLDREKLEALEAGLAAIADATALTASSLNAAIRITRTLLEPLHVTVTLLGTEASRKYLLIEFNGLQAHKSLDPPDQRKPRILPTHDFPSQDTKKEKAS